MSMKIDTERGKIFEKMWGELTRLLNLTSYLLSGENIRKEMENIEQKYLQKEEEHPTPLEELKLQAKIFNDVLDGEVNKGYIRMDFRRDNALLSLFNYITSMQMFPKHGKNNKGGN